MMLYISLLQARYTTIFATTGNENGIGRSFTRPIFPVRQKMVWE